MLLSSSSPSPSSSSFTINRPSIEENAVCGSFPDTPPLDASLSRSDSKKRLERRPSPSPCELVELLKLRTFKSKPNIVALFCCCLLHSFGRWIDGLNLRLTHQVQLHPFQAALSFLPPRLASGGAVEKPGLFGWQCGTSFDSS